MSGLPPSDIEYMQGYVDGYFQRNIDDEHFVAVVYQTELSPTPKLRPDHSHSIQILFRFSDLEPLPTCCTHTFNPNEFPREKMKTAIERCCRRILETLPEIRRKKTTPKE